MSETNETVTPQEPIDVKVQLQEQIDAWNSLGEDEKENCADRHDALETDEAVENASSEAIAEHLRQHKLNKETPAYVVRGAELMCDQGTNKRQMNLSPCHGVYIRGHAVPHELDCIQGEEDNIPMFGVCNSGEAPDAELIKLVDDNGQECHGKKCCPKIVGVWQDSFEGTWIVDTEKREEDLEKIEGCNTITMDSFLVCKYGGIIMPVNSGQDREVGEEEFCNPDEAPEVLGFADECAKQSDIEGGCGDLLHEYHLNENREALTVGIHGNNYFTVTFRYDDGEIIKRQEVRLGEDAIAPANIEKEGYVFDGWDREYTNVTEDMLVTALFKLSRVDPTDTQAVKEFIWNYFIDRGYTEYMVAGILGNIHVETGGTFNPEIINLSNGFCGLCQYGGERKKDLIEKGKLWAQEKEWAKDRWEDGWKDLEFQCQYALEECNHPNGTGWIDNIYFDIEIQQIDIGEVHFATKRVKMKGTKESFRNASSATEAALIWAACYERCIVKGESYMEEGKSYRTKYQAQQERCEWAEHYYLDFRK